MYLPQLSLLAIVLASGAVSAQTDRFGREISGGLRLPAVPSNTPGSSHGTLPGTFYLRPFETHTTGSSAQAVVIGDVSGDGRSDVVLTTTFYFDEDNDYRLFIFKQSPVGALQDPTTYPYGQVADENGLAVADLDGHEGLDVAVGGNGGMTLFLADGGGMTPGTFLPVGRVDSITTVVLDGSGIDLLGASHTDTVQRIFGDGGGAFTISTPWTTPYFSMRSFASGDFDRDGRDDIAFVVSGCQIITYRNMGNGDLTLLNGPTPADCKSAIPITSMDIGDLNRDGILDIATSGGGNLPDAYIQVFYGVASGGFANPVVMNSYHIPETMRVVDINDDTRNDIIVLHGGWERVGVYLQADNGTLGPETLYPISYASHYYNSGLAVADFTGDDCPDVAIADYNFGLVTLEGTGCVGRVFESGFE